MAHRAKSGRAGRWGEYTYACLKTQSILVRVGRARSLCFATLSHPPHTHHCVRWLHAADTVNPAKQLSPPTPALSRAQVADAPCENLGFRLKYAWRAACLSVRLCGARLLKRGTALRAVEEPCTRATGGLGVLIATLVWAPFSQVRAAAAVVVPDRQRRRLLPVPAQAGARAARELPGRQAREDGLPAQVRTAHTRHARFPQTKPTLPLVPPRPTHEHRTGLLPCSAPPASREPIAERGEESRSPLL